MRRMFFRGVMLGMACILGSTSQARANEITFFDTVFDTDYVTSAIGLRDVGTGAITVSGVTGTVTRAYLFWHGPTSSSNPAANADVTVAGNSVTGTQIGFSDDNFWGMDNSQAYRADVTGLITGDGSYALSGFQNLPLVAINGASLFVFFDDGSAANNRDVVLFNGNDANFSSAFDLPGWDVTLSGINYSGGTTNFRTYVSDGQNFGANDDGTLSVNGTPIATGGIFQGLSPQAPGAGVSNGSLTDISIFDITALMLLGPNTLHVTLTPGSLDALSLVVAAIDLPAGAAPPVTPIPEPMSMLLVGTGLLGLARSRRRKN